MTKKTKLMIAGLAAAVGIGVAPAAMAAPCGGGAPAITIKTFEKKNKLEFLTEEEKTLLAGFLKKGNRKSDQKLLKLSPQELKDTMTLELEKKNADSTENKKLS